MSKYSKNDELPDQQDTARLYHRLSQLHLEIAKVYAELVTSNQSPQTVEKAIQINSKSGKPLANLLLMDGKVRVEITSHLPTDNAPYSWLKNHLKSITDNEKVRFRLGEEDHLLRSIEIDGNITPDLVKKLQSALGWAFSRMSGESNIQIRDQDSETKEENKPNA